MMIRLERNLTRRTFLQAGVLGSTAFATSAFAAGSDSIKVGLVGCGGRGVAAAMQCAEVDPGVRIIAVADAFSDQLESCRTALQKNVGTQFDVSDGRSFVGLDAYRRLIDSTVDVVLLAAPSGFRPTHVEYAVEAGKHIFAEASGAVDSTGVRKLLKAYGRATQKNLTVVCGLSDRYSTAHRETIQRIKDGQIGDIVQGRCSWIQDVSFWNRKRLTGWSDTEFQIRNWPYFIWLSGDMYLNGMLYRQLDVMNWLLDGHPLKVSGYGERRVYGDDPQFGNILDHFVLKYTYPSKVVVDAECGIAASGQKANIFESVTASKGASVISQHKIDDDTGGWKYSGNNNNPYAEEQRVLIEHVRSNKPVNELKILAESALTSIMGRMAAYAGEEVTWEQALNSPEDLMPKNLAWGPLAVAPIRNSKSKASGTPTISGSENKYAFLVGVRNYDKNELRNLRYSEPDIVEMSRVFLEAGYRKENIVLMTQTRGAEDDRFLPLADKIRRELRLLLKGLTEDDSVIVAFAGHGVQFKDDAEVYFCPAGARLADRQTLVSLTEIYSELEKCPAKFKLLLSDACRNDPLSENVRSLQTVNIESVTRPRKKTPPGGVAAIFSCSEGEQAFEHEDLKHGVFFHFMIKGLQGEADGDRDGIVTLDELKNYLKKRVTAFVRAEYGREQTPDTSNDHTKGLIPLVEIKK